MLYEVITQRERGKDECVKVHGLLSRFSTGGAGRGPGYANPHARGGAAPKRSALPGERTAVQVEEPAVVRRAEAVDERAHRGDALGRVITSYSIHYTKLYETD